MNTGIFWENFLRVIAVIGLIAVLLLGAWGIIQLAFFIPSLFSGSPALAPETLNVSAPASVTAGQPFTLNWKHTGGSGDYSYSVSYACGNGTSVAAPVPTGAYELVPCGTPFNYINASSSMPLIPVLATSTTQGSFTFTVAATKLSTGAIAQSGSATVNASAPAQSAKPATAASKPSTPAATSKPASTYVASGHTSNLYGYPDLAVHMLSASSQSGYVTVKFEIINAGTNMAPAGWSFNAIVPINGQYTYPAGAQRALYPGDYIIYTLTYNVGSNYNYPNNYYSYGNCDTNNYNYTGTYGYTLYNTQPCIPSQQGYGYTYPYGYGSQSTVSVNVDPYNQLPELTKANNSASATYVNY